MGIFKSKEEKEQKREQKVKRFLAQHDLDDLNPKSYQLVKNIMSQNGLIDLLAYSLGARIHGSDAENMIINNLQTIVEQNWLMIKQNDTLQKQNAEIINNLKK
ncbi:hypothetical protein KTE19_13185 [Lentilactobacillus sp. IMAU92037]|uniref:hypothetical protein n=1 Tax=Lentilactobacillus dabitei TaxID=2831523 RepID=UPI001C2C61DF|nr:hypothetical protein [Lentilactobacillus dabitei]MBV0931620.1 hypothetical protein [Lentilactobacillus dabitei]